MDVETERQCGLSPSEQQKWISKFENSEKELLENVIFKDTEEWSSSLEKLKVVGGLDISYHKTIKDTACVSIAILSFPDLKLLHHDTSIESVAVPYIPSYLAYREAEHYLKKIQNLKGTNFYPQLLFVDGNGALHPRKFGSAVRVGVDSDIPTIGVAKSLMVMEDLGIVRHIAHEKIKNLSGKGSCFDLMTTKGEVLGKAVRSSEKSYKPIYVSIGHRCSLETAVRVTLACCLSRIPEPIRQADHISKMKLKEA